MAPPKKSSSSKSVSDNTPNSDVVKTPKSPGRPKASGQQAKSPSRTKSPARTKSPGRAKSPGRPKSASRTKSPGRIISPTREYPVRNRKPIDLGLNLVPTTPPRPKRAGRLTPSRRSPIRGAESGKKERDTLVLNRKQPSIDLDTESDSENYEIREKPKATVRGRTRLDWHEKSATPREPSSESTASSRPFHRVTRSHQQELERIIHVRHSDAAKKLTEFSDEDEFVRESSVPAESRILSKFTDNLGLIYSLLVIPILGFYLYSICDQYDCTFRIPTKLPDLSNVNWYLVLAYFIYLITLVLLSAVPFGGPQVESLPGKNEKFIYTANGLFIATLVLMASWVVDSFKIWPVYHSIISNGFQLFIIALTTAVHLAVYIFAVSYSVPISALNPKILNRGRLYKFIMGRELHPRLIRRVDWKFLMYRSFWITELLILWAYVYKNYEETATTGEDISNIIRRLEPTLVTYVFLRFLNILDKLVYERTRVTTKEIQQEGFGYALSVRYLVEPFVTLFVIKYIVEHHVKLATWILIVISFVYVYGLLLSRKSNNMKDAFRKNPYSPSFSHMETIPTNQGKKILAAGPWGRCRHPNYLGDIITELALVPFAPCHPPVILKLHNILYLIHRAHLDNQHCKERYGVAWDRYCNRVRYLLVPKVY